MIIVFTNFNKKIIGGLVFLLFFINGLNSQSIIVGDTASSLVKYVDITDTIIPFTVKNQSNFDIDIDFDSIYDIRFHFEHSSSPSFGSVTYSIISLDTVQFTCLSNSSDIDSLSEGTLIDNSLFWNFNTSFFYYSFTSNIPPPWGSVSSSHGVCTKSNTYFGFRKIYETDTIYGWFLIDLLNPYKIRAYAIENKLIYNVQNYLSNTNSISIFPNPATNFITISSHFKPYTKFQLLIYDSNGREKLNKNIELTTNYSIDLSFFKNGLYLIILKNNKEQYENKIVINR